MLSPFGRAARHNANNGNSLDLALECDWPTGDFELAHPHLSLDERAGCRVRVGTNGRRKPHVQDRVLGGAGCVSSGVNGLWSGPFGSSLVAALREQRDGSCDGHAALGGVAVLRDAVR